MSSENKRSALRSNKVAFMQLLVSLEGNTFKAILNPSGSLVD